jgi:uncharacterized protein (TIGR02001 family)
MKFAKAGLVLMLMAGTAQADLTGNLGFASDYYFRGVYQAPTSGSGGLDYENGGFYIGTWAADVKDGLETDLYFGYGTEVGEVSLSVGYTGYFYTGDFDDTYQEINLGAGIGILSVEVAIGEYDAPPSDAICTDSEPPACSPSKSDYIYYALTLEKNGFYGKYAGFSEDFSGDYFEVGYGTTVAEIDLGIALVVNDKDLNIFSDTSGDESLIFTIGKSFDIN